MTCLFVVGVAFSAVFQSGQLVSVLPTMSLRWWSLHKVHPDRPSLLRNSIIKIIIVVLAVAGAITFAALYGTVSASPTLTDISAGAPGQHAVNTLRPSATASPQLAPQWNGLLPSDSSSTFSHSLLISGELAKRARGISAASGVGRTGMVYPTKLRLWNRGMGLCQVYRYIG